MLERLINIETRYNELNELLVSPEVVTDIKKMTELSREQSGLREPYNAYQTYKQLTEDIEAAKEM